MSQTLSKKLFFLECKIKIHELPSLWPTPDISDDDDLSSEYKKERSCNHEKKKSKKWNSSKGSFRDDVGSVTSGNNFKDENDLLSLTSVWWQRKNASRIKVLRAMQRSYAKAVKYRTYCLKHKSQWCTSNIESKVAKLGKMVRSQLKETDFVKMDSISILAFLKKFCDACERIGAHKAGATWLVSNFMKKLASLSLKALLLRKKIRLTKFCDERLPLYVKDVKYLLRNFANNNIIVREIEKKDFNSKIQKNQPR